MTPFNLDDDQAYRLWRAEKLGRYPRRAEDIMVAMDDREAVLRVCRAANMAIYTTNDEFDMKTALDFCASLGLRQMDNPLLSGADGISRIEVSTMDHRTGYIPYTNRPLSWHSAVWRDDAAIAKARDLLNHLLAGNEPLTIRHRLISGQGLISNNVLHDHSGFEDHDEPNQRRLLYRARFLEPHRLIMFSEK